MYLSTLSTEKQATDAFSGISISTWWLSACSPPILVNQELRCWKWVLALKNYWKPLGSKEKNKDNLHRAEISWSAILFYTRPLTHTHCCKWRSEYIWTIRHSPATRIEILTVLTLAWFVRMIWPEPPAWLAGVLALAVY